MSSQTARRDPSRDTDLLLVPFRDQLVRPPVLRSVAGDDVDRYRIEVRTARKRLHADLPDTPLWTYNGVYPGPTIEARCDRPVEIEWVNSLGDGNHPIRTFIGNPSPNETSQSRVGRDATGRWLPCESLPSWVIAHLHGAVVPAQSDGWPDNGMMPGMSIMTRHPNRQRAALLWYHDHAMGQTAQNVYAGLAGLFIVRDDEEAALSLPSEEHELPLLLQDRNLDLGADGKPNGALLYKLDQPNGEFYGPYTLVNGTIWPFVEVPAVPHRLRILNGSNARFYRLTLEEETQRTKHSDLLTLIGSDGGLLAAPVPVRGALLLAPGERVDVIADFRECMGHRLVLRNDAPAPFPSGHAPSSDVVMQFRIAAQKTGGAIALPAVLSRIEPIAIERAAATRVITLQEDPANPGMMRLNGKGFHDGVDEMPRLGDIEIWEFRNPTDDSHPMHLHLVAFQVLSRAQLDDGNPSTQPLTISDAERGWKDVVCCHPGQATRIAARFVPYTGQYMYHCHILEHEDHDMMRAYIVLPPGMSM
jgi:FtsP/CotA-like multicopper oxidase with cupredoxin domain